MNPEAIFGLKVTLTHHSKKSQPRQSGEIRRIGVPVNFSFQSFCELVSEWTTGKGIYDILYIDDENDIITLSEEEEWEEAKKILVGHHNSSPTIAISVVTCSIKNARISLEARSADQQPVEVLSPRPAPSSPLPLPTLLQGCPTANRRELPPSSSLRDANFGDLPPRLATPEPPISSSSSPVVPKIQIKQELRGWKTAQLCPTCEIYTNTGLYPGHCCSSCILGQGLHSPECKKFLFDVAVEVSVEATPRVADTPRRELIDKVLLLLIGEEGRDALYSKTRTPRELGCGDWLSADLVVNSSLLQERIQNVGYVALASNNPSDKKLAIDYYRLGTELQPDIPYTWLNLARALCADDQKQAAIDAIDMAINKNSTVDISKDPAFFPLRGMHRFVALCRITRSLTNSSCASDVPPEAYAAC
eukprot:TRINITY_DN9991_c0_g2_i2.p1 TRINITY_DN9991_c0_g2~~TRINITY_DN9991_c0_g2_i2.p1  ORF type:complete len:418 (+),score=59.24 TRINITY_DN9991_c0_g2_i2:60-1313(+)